ncbi:MAG: FRG domain-containing protein [Anaerolineales bacterium]|nr:MAG: FRG domain-containing protein [Anaerolineales bacterium]
MEEHNLNSWAEFKEVVDQLRKDYGYFEHNNRILFRGQPNLPLKTTLERKNPFNLTQFNYLLLAMKSVDEVESYTGKEWGVPDYLILKDEIDKMQKQTWHEVHFPRSIYSYLIYLRHHGYPSPLLDWTTSPYIAAYFAMCDSPREKSKLLNGECEMVQDDKVAIYAYIEYLTNIKSLDNPVITVLRPYINTHRRHFSQKAWYTVASRWSEESAIHTYCSHHEVFDSARKSYDVDQDLLLKITIPTSDRKQALKELDTDYNINNFTLFQTEDALIKTIGMREFDHE